MRGGETDGRGGEGCVTRMREERKEFLFNHLTKEPTRTKQAVSVRCQSQTS